MNQFKKAKQKALESGHQVENIKDLQTAGVKTTVEDKKIIETPIATEPEPVPVPVEVPAAVEPAPVDLETPVAAEPAAVHVEVPVTAKPIPVPVETPVIAESVTIPVAAPVTAIAEPVYEEPALEPIVSVQQASPVPVPVRVAPAPVVQEVTYTAPVVTPVPTASKASTTKKNIPNIFAPKNEAKSMRKSLVLKPTSVKIAENYCAKNGGSFNELIQTLLDNFIDEYGL